MTNQTLDQLTALTLPPLRTDLLPILRPSIGVLESITFGNLLDLLPFQGQINGLTLSTTAASSTYGIAAGQATDSTNATVMSLLSAYTKTTAAWVAGSGHGSLDTGAVAANTWYHSYLIQRSDTGFVDVLMSTNANTPTLPSGYTNYRRIGSMKTDGAFHFLQFQQIGDTFVWKTPIVSVNAVTPGVSGGSNTIVIATPLGVQVEAIFTAVAAYSSGVTTELRLYPTFALAVPVFADLYAPAGVPLSAGQFRIETDASAQIVTNLTFGAGATYSIEIDGWVDRRGRS